MNFLEEGNTKQKRTHKHRPVVLQSLFFPPPLECACMFLFLCFDLGWVQIQVFYLEAGIEVEDQKNFSKSHLQLSFLFHSRQWLTFIDYLVCARYLILITLCKSRLSFYFYFGKLRLSGQILASYTLKVAKLALKSVSQRLLTTNRIHMSTFLQDSLLLGILQNQNKIVPSYN